MVINYFNHTPASSGDSFESILSRADMAAAFDEISGWEGYAETAVHSLSQLALQCGVDSVWYKDESSRFGLGSFKSLGGAYAVLKLAGDNADASGYTVTTATDGNHGRSVAWGARRAGCRAVIFVHQEVSAGRVAAMEAFGAEVIRINGNYDDSVAACAQQAEQHGWQIVSDTSWAGYVDVPKLVMAGYTVMMRELAQQLTEPPTHLLLPAGVGTFAASMVVAAAAVWNPLPRIVVVESNKAACLLKSAQAGAVREVVITDETMMAGLSCGEPALLAWEVLRAAASDFVAIDDSQVAAAMRDLAKGAYGGGNIEAGECSTAGIIALQALQSAAVDNKVFDANSKVLVFGTEGATDIEQYQKIINKT